MSIRYLTPKKSVAEIRSSARRSESTQAVAELMFVKMAQEEQFDETTITEYPDLFVVWDENWRGKRGDIVQDEGNLYRSIHDVNDAGQNTKPSETPSMWTPLGKPGEEFPDWVQPLGAHDAYAQGAKVSHKGKKWVSAVANNVWEPGVYGWDEYVEPVKAEEPVEVAAGTEVAEPAKTTKTARTTKAAKAVQEAAEAPEEPSEA